MGKQPLANNLLTNPGKVKKYPLELMQCQHCSFIQLSYVIAKEQMYDEYFYVSSVSRTQRNHFRTLALTLKEELPLAKNDLVVDIGSNDGSLLKCFQNFGMDVLGVEPAKNITSVVPTLPEYFTKSVARKIVALKGKAKLVTATNVFAHIDNVTDFIDALDILLADDGVFFAQFPDVRNIFSQNQFDTIYHEHLSYFTYEPLYHLFAISPFEIYKIDSNSIHGGSMRIYVKRRKPLIRDFISSVAKVKKELIDYITKEKLKGKRIVAFGAAAKGMVLLNYCKFNDLLIEYIADGTSYKQGKYAPGVNIPILAESELLKRPPDIVLILAWNFKEEIMEKLKGRGYMFVIPIPKVEVIKG